MDKTVFVVINGWYSSAPVLWALFDSWMAVAALVLLCLGLCYLRQEQRWLLPALLAVALTDMGVVRVFKPLVARERPCAVLERSYVPRDEFGPHCGSGSAMPSAHAANTMALAAVLGFPELALISAVVGVSRVTTGQHWPSDVLAGWAIGLCSGSAVRWAFRRFLGWP